MTGTLKLNGAEINDAVDFLHGGEIIWDVKVTGQFPKSARRIEIMVLLAEDVKGHQTLHLYLRHLPEIETAKARTGRIAPANPNSISTIRGSINGFYS